VPRTILNIDDDRQLCDLVGELLRGEGFESMPIRRVRAPSSWRRAGATSS
jgi:DNA-binding response OmpR family regulator